ncbi:MAG: MmgE/PrpD family protein [Mesorhizobium sp.]
MESAARSLAIAASRSCFAKAAPEIRSAYRDFLLDTIAVMAAGSAHPSLAPARAAFVAAGGTGDASAAGFAQGVPAAVAGLVNGAAMTVLQLQDGHRRARGHPMSHVLPAALAVAEEVGAPASAFLDAVMAGYEVSARVGASLGGMQPLLHDTGTFGCIGAAVAAAHLLAHGNDVESRAAIIEATIGNSAAVALFPFRDTCMEGASGHHLFVGLGVQNGINAARAALAGLAPSHATLERFFGPRAGEAFDPPAMTDGIGPDGNWERYEIASAYLKWHPVCAHLGPMLDCIDELRERLGGFDPARIDELRVEVYSTALQYDSPSPASDLAARFSFRHAAALAICFGALPPDGFSSERLNHPQISDLVSKVVLEADAGFDALYPANRPGRVTVVMSDGTREAAEVSISKGDGTRALTRVDVDAKATGLLTSAWAGDRPASILRLVDGVEGEPVPNLPHALGHALRQPFRI